MLLDILCVKLGLPPPDVFGHAERLLLPRLLFTRGEMVFFSLSLLPKICIIVVMIHLLFLLLPFLLLYKADLIPFGQRHVVHFSPS